MRFKKSVRLAVVAGLFCSLVRVLAEVLNAMTLSPRNKKHINFN
jgi:hypothetical protein